MVGSRAGSGRDALTAPGSPATHWEQLYFPLLSPLEAKPGETVAIDLRSRTSPDAGTHVAWTATQRSAKGRELSRQALNSSTRVSCPEPPIEHQLISGRAR